MKQGKRILILLIILFAIIGVIICILLNIDKIKRYIGVIETISISGDYKTVYTVGDVIDTSKLNVTAIYSNGKTKEVTNYNTSGFSSVKEGSGKIRVTYKNFEASYGYIVNKIAENEYTEAKYFQYIENEEGNIEILGLKFDNIDFKAMYNYEYKDNPSIICYVENKELEVIRIPPKINDKEVVSVSLVKNRENIQYYIEDKLSKRDILSTAQIEIYGIKSIVYSENITSVLGNKTVVLGSLKNAIIPKNVENIGDYAFYGTNGVINVEGKKGEKDFKSLGLLWQGFSEVIYE